MKFFLRFSSILWISFENVIVQRHLSYLIYLCTLWMIQYSTASCRLTSVSRWRKSRNSVFSNVSEFGRKSLVFRETRKRICNKSQYFQMWEARKHKSIWTNIENLLDFVHIQWVYTKKATLWIQALVPHSVLFQLNKFN